MASGTIQLSAGLPTVITDNTTFTGTGNQDKTYTVSGSGIVIAYISSYSVSGNNDNGTAQAIIWHNNTQIMAAGISQTPQASNSNGSFVACPISVSNGDTIAVRVQNAHTGGTLSMYRRFLCFGGCTVS